MKNKQIWSFIILAFLVINLNSICFSMNEKNLNEQSLMINNINDKDINIEIKSVEIINKTVNLNKTYKDYAVISMDISNLGLDYVELSNINYSIYQDNIKLETFIESENNYLGFVGKLPSGDKKQIKICVALNNTTSPIKFIFENLSDATKENVKKEINL